MMGYCSITKIFPCRYSTNKGRRKGKFSFELRFDKRISNGVSAWESGFYKGEFMQEGKPPMFTTDGSLCSCEKRTEPGKYGSMPTPVRTPRKRISARRSYSVIKNKAL